MHVIESSNRDKWSSQMLSQPVEQIACKDLHTFQILDKKKIYDGFIKGKKSNVIIRSETRIYI